MATHLNYAVPSDAGLFETVSRLTTSVLGVGEAVALEYMGSRLRQLGYPEGAEEFLQLEEANNLLHKHDEEEYRQEKSRRINDIRAEHSYRKEFAAAREKYQPPAPHLETVEAQTSWLVRLEGMGAWRLGGSAPAAQVCAPIVARRLYGSRAEVDIGGVVDPVLAGRGHGSQFLPGAGAVRRLTTARLVERRARCFGRRPRSSSGHASIPI